MRRTVSGGILLLVLAAGVILGQNFSFNMPGLPGDAGDGDLEVQTEVADDPAPEAAATNQASDDFLLLLQEDRIYYKGEPIDLEALDPIIAAAKEQDAIIEVEYDPDTVTGLFVEQLLDLLRTAEVKHIGIVR